MTAPLALFIVADLLMHLESLGVAVPAGLGWRLAVGAPIVLISVIGGRIIPSFTRNWLFKRKSPQTSLTSGHARYRGGGLACRRAHPVGVSSSTIA